MRDLEGKTKEELVAYSRELIDVACEAGLRVLENIDCDTAEGFFLYETLSTILKDQFAVMADEITEELEEIDWDEVKEGLEPGESEPV